MDSSLATLAVTSLGHVTEVLSPAFDAGTLFYKVNVTSLMYTKNASASSETATGGSGWKSGSRHLQYPNTRVIVSARDATTTSYIAHAFFQPFPCDCYAGTCHTFDSSWSAARGGTDPVAMPIVLEYTTQHTARADVQ